MGQTPRVREGAIGSVVDTGHGCYDVYDDTNRATASWNECDDPAILGGLVVGRRGDIWDENGNDDASGVQTPGEGFLRGEAFHCGSAMPGRPFGQCKVV